MAGGSHRVDAEGHGPLARFFDLVAVTQWASVRLAFRSGVDPGPIEAIDRLKGSI
jgi:hypothetical protein